MYADPVHGKAFFDREEIVSHLEKRVGALRKGFRQNIAILGPELVGKTSLVYRLLGRIKADDIILMYLEVGEENLGRLGLRFLHSLVGYYGENVGVRHEGDLAGTCERLRKFIPKTSESILQVEKLLKKRRGAQVFGALLDIVASLQEETSKSILLVLDQFHNLAGIGVENVFGVFGQKIMTQKQVMYLMTSSACERSRRILGQDLSLLFGNFEVNYLRAFDARTSMRFLDWKLNPVSLSEGHKKFLIGLTSGHPFYLDRLAGALRDACRERGHKQVPASVIIQVLMGELFSPSAILHQYFARKLESISQGNGSPVLTDILVQLAEGKVRASEIAKELERSRGQTRKNLDRLARMDFLDRCGKVYRLSDPLFRFWLRHVRGLRESAFQPSTQDLAKAFEDRTGEFLSTYLAEEKKGTGQRMRDLFRLFRNDIVELGGRTFRLPKFQDVANVSLQGGELPVVAHSSRRHWVAAIEEKPVTEEDVKLFADRLKALRRRVARKIMVSLAGVEADAKLLAQEEGIWIWGEGEVNLLEDLHGQMRTVPGSDRAAGGEQRKREEGKR